MGKIIATSLRVQFTARTDSALDKVFNLKCHWKLQKINHKKYA
jgi:hypothetical protein